MKLSVVIPARNEEGNISSTVQSVAEALRREQIGYEVLVVDDGCTDGTAAVVHRLSLDDPCVRLVTNLGPHGYGMAVRTGLAAFTGEAVAIMMADCSDSPTDLVRYYRKLEEGYECAFGSRFIEGGRVIDYPPHKLLLNRLANAFIKFLFAIPYNDVTNAFKCYHRKVIQGLEPLISHHFNLTVEMPLKAIIRGYSYDVVPITWTNRVTGISKLKIKEMGGRYLFIVLYLWLEKHLAKGDYRRDPQDVPAEGETRRVS